ncbi:MAG: exodeoxyribonuclease V subunit alpha [Propioniciclava sp.]|uniref:exodeoxyribonuclease V subunit alpha n=1 Tax=Propioniciclava sp. TaxID=2038686 RepID=UPI0039E266C5
MTDPKTATTGDRLLADFNAAGALTWADVHPAQHLAHLFGEQDSSVKLAIALTVRALRAGSLCLPLNRMRELDLGEDAVEIPEDWWPESAAWERALRASPAVTVGDAGPGSRPLRLVDGALYLERHFADQESVRRSLLARLAAAPASGSPEGQQAAIALALSSPVTVIAGGPGVGKTYTIRKIIQRLRADDPGALVGLAAPTGKAAARMTESLGDSGLTALTLHALLGSRAGSRTRFLHDAERPLPHDVVIVDEMSMVSMVMMSRLLDALKPSARLILVGDPDQLSSVDAGSVLADITRAPASTGIVARLTHNHRFGGDIATLAHAIRDGDADAALAVLERASADPWPTETGVRYGFSDAPVPTDLTADPAVAGDVTSGGTHVALVDLESGAALLRDRAVSAGRAVFAAASAHDPEAALRALDAHRLLCGHRGGQYGVARWAREVQAWLAHDVDGYSTEGEFHLGRPVMVTANRPEFGLFNGDTGVILLDDGRPQAWFRSGGRLQRLSPFLLEGLASVHAMTVHKAQGSQFAHVSVVLPPPGSPLLTRELLYTAVSRAQSSVLLLGDRDAVAEAISRPARRMSGLAERLR